MKKCYKVALFIFATLLLTELIRVVEVHVLTQIIGEPDVWKWITLFLGLLPAAIVLWFLVTFVLPLILALVIMFIASRIIHRIKRKRAAAKSDQ